LREQVAGIIGYGSIGRECGRQLSAMGMRVVCSKRDPNNRRDEGYAAWPGTGDPDGKIPERWFGPSELHHMLPLCDVIVITTPSTAATLNMIGPAEFELMKKSAVLINVARGGIVDEGALAEAVRRKQIAGAQVDCFTTEPIPSDHVFFDVPGIILTPHMAGVSTAFWIVMAALLKQNLARFSAGQPILNRVSIKHGY
jgi:phosphoglycerate dehydrogenase-like enzyme